MEYATWNGKNLIALEVADEFEMEREVRKASKRKELFCPDKDCQQPVRYCHGEIKGAYFAHLNNDSCDYGDFDRTDNPVFRAIRLKLYEHFKTQGYNVQCEQKVLSHHYCQLFFALQDGQKLAIEFGTKRTSATIMDKLTEEYESANIAVRWLIIGDDNYANKENQMYYIKRYLLNKATYQEFLMVDTKAARVKQVRWDTKKYDMQGQSISGYGIEEFYSEDADIDSLSLINNELVLIGFNNNYDKWLTKKKELIDARVRQMIALKKEQEEKRKQREQQQLSAPPIEPISRPIYPIYAPPMYRYQPQPNLSYEARKAEVIDRLNQDEEGVWDSTGRRWLKCELCGAIGDDGEFNNYGGPNRMASGVCNECARKSRK